MQAAGAASLLTKSSQGEGAGKSSPRHGAEPHAKIPFHAVLGKALGAKSRQAAEAAGKDQSAALAALRKILKKGFPAGANGVAARENGKARHSDGASPHLAVTAGLPEAGELQESAELGRLVAKNDNKKKTANVARHADGLDAGRLLIAAGLSQGLKGFPGARPEQAQQPPKEPGGHAEAAVSAVRKGHDLRVHVLDLRKKAGDGPAGDSPATVNAARPAGPEKDSPAPVLPREATSPAIAREAQRPVPVVASPFAGAFERLRDMAGSELTRAAAIVLREGGGEIKLVLKPESLGSVRIRMNLVDNAIEGRIIVDNPAVKHVFEGNLGSLMRALTAEGFQTASLQVSVGGQNGDNGRQEREPAPRIRRVGAAEGFERNVPGVESMSLGDLLVNLFV